MKSKSFQIHKKSSVKSSSKKYSRFLGCFSISLLIIGLIGIAIFNIFKVTEIVIINESLEIGDGYIDFKNKINQEFLSTSIIVLKSDDIQTYINKNYGRYEIYDFIKTYPSRIEFKIRLINEKYFVQANNGSFSISEGFYVIEANQNRSNFNLRYYKDLQLGQLITDEILIRALKYSELENASIEVDDKILLKIGDNTLVYLDESKNREPQEILDLLKNILQKYSIENREIEVIDLRYSEPLIKFR